MIYVSFVSKNTPYEEVINRYLIPSLKKWNLSYDIDYIENRGSWKANVLYKPLFIKKMLLKHKQSIVSLDADASIEQYPYLFKTLDCCIKPDINNPNICYPAFDIGAHWLDWDSWYGHANGKKELLGGTLYFNYNDKVLNLIDKWIKQHKSHNNLPQRLLEQIIKKSININIYELPLEYCYIATLPNGKEPLIKLNPVILHHQVSRKLRNKIT